MLGVLSKSKHVVSSIAFIITSHSNQLSVPNAAYGPTKAAVHWITIRINGENDWLNALVLDPGFPQTDMGNFAANLMGLKEAPLKLDICCGGIVQVLAASTKEKHGGKLVLYDGTIEEF